MNMAMVQAELGGKASCGLVNILITEEQDSNPEFREKGAQWYIGFLPESQVLSYFCKKCDRHYENSPEINVYIHRHGTRDSNTGTEVSYKCTGCNKLLHSEHLESPEGIDPKYIAFDETGDWKRPAPEDIEAQLSRARLSAENGEGNNMRKGHYRKPLEQALHWAGKISYKIPRQTVKELRTAFRNAYLRNMERELPTWVNTIKQKAYGFSSMEPDDSGLSAFEGTGLYEDFEPFYEALPHINIPDDPKLKMDIVRILDAYKKMFQDSTDKLEEQRRELEKRADAAIGEAIEINFRTNMFIDRAGMTASHIAEARRDPLSTFPGDYDDDTSV